MNQMRRSIDYIKEIQKQGNVRSHFQKQEQLYSADINLAIYMDLTDVQKLNIFDIVTINQKQDFVVNFYGFRMRQDDHLNERLYKLFIREMDAMLRNQNKRKYFVVLFDSTSENKNCFDHLKEIYKRLPAVYFVKLKKIFHVQPGFLTKSLGFIHFSSWSKLFHKHVEFVQNVQSVQEIAQIKNFNILAKCPKQITRGVKLQTQTPNMVKSAVMGKKPKPFDCLKRDLKDYPMDQTRGVPLILSILIETMKQSRQLCMIEGIFRIAGSIQDQEQLLKSIIDIKTFRLLDCQACCKRSIAGLMKKIFTESTTPLIPYPVYNYILNEPIDQKNIDYFWKTIINQLPKLNRQVLCYVTQFLRYFILKNKENNKMNAHNLSVVFNPCFFRGKECSLADLMYSGKFAAFFKWWLQNYDSVMQQVGTPQTPTGNSYQQKEQQNSRTRKNVEQIKYDGDLRIQNQKLVF